MLVLGRRPGESILIGPDVEVYVLAAEGGQVRLGVRAPREVAVLRRELLEQVQDENRRATASPSAPLLERLRAHAASA
jgi:carbon storage regulator